MSDRANLHCLGNGDAVCHKGFYNDENFIKSLAEICYDDFFELPDDDLFPYSMAYPLLCGSCHIFAESLQKTFMLLVKSMSKIDFIILMHEA